MGWESGYKNAHSYLNINCETHGIFKVSATNCISAGSRCPKCMVCGFDNSKVGHLYVIRVQGIHEEFTGYGISNKIRRRMAEHRYLLGRYGFKIVEEFSVELNGKVAEDLEGKIKEVFPLYKNNIPSFVTEACCYSKFGDVISYIRENLK